MAGRVERSGACGDALAGMPSGHRARSDGLARIRWGMLIASYFPVVVTLGVAMADRIRSDIDDADEIIARSVADLQLAGVSDSAVAAALLLRSMMLWRRDGLTDDEIVCEFGKCIQLPFGRNSPRGSKRAPKLRARR